ncbi:hypothetical protein MPTK1_1g12770 [Marchantia polymorpha subsp. ruderalis]|uniref:Uncharacterized protein n=2 Tax=Marchantia polymorpha TaxID=3197 RepID=A0AAF6APH4_MARPO|nr:hypothetical protein MARPO_0019s0047 [Marchantia polymorpha]BBM98344.1 hypothetical protein Mp_1g12770 [Marchantia polymorpha subsp. ruderalis]|eukprot:PTQ44611.1 hypothetical protein MARPO_0019s0047 [Marchantia polymorpha]
MTGAGLNLGKAGPDLLVSAALCARRVVHQYNLLKYSSINNPRPTCPVSIPCTRGQTVSLPSRPPSPEASNRSAPLLFAIVQSTFRPHLL